VLLWTISPSVAKARKVPATLVRRTSSKRNGTVRGESGTTVSDTRPVAIITTATRYQRLRVSV